MNQGEENIKVALKQFIHESILDSQFQLSYETSFQEMGIDSLSLVELILFLERKFKLTIPEEHLVPENFESINSLAACAHSLLLKQNM